jgi:hypothetical protein
VRGQKTRQVHVIREFGLWVVNLFVIATVGLSLACGSTEPRKVDERPAVGGQTPSAPRTTPVLGTALEGVYTNAHTVGSVGGADQTVEDVVEIVRYDPTRVFFRIAAHFDNGHSCAVHGIATLEQGAFVYRSRQLPLPNQRPCTLRVEATTDQLRITDRLEPNGAATCREFCGVRGNLSDFAISRTHRRAIEDIANVKNSTEFAEAVLELNTKELSR